MKHHFPKFSKPLKLIEIFMYNCNLTVIHCLFHPGLQKVEMENWIDLPC